MVGFIRESIREITEEKRERYECTVIQILLNKLNTKDSLVFTFTPAIVVVIVVVVVLPLLPPVFELGSRSLLLSGWDGACEIFKGNVTQEPLPTMPVVSSVPSSPECLCSQAFFNL